MPTTKIKNTPPKPTARKETDDELLARALSCGGLGQLATGATDDELLAAIDVRWRQAPVSGPRQYCVAVGDKVWGTAIWFDVFARPSLAPHYQTAGDPISLLAAVRRVLGIGLPSGAAAQYGSSGQLRADPNASDFLTLKAKGKSRAKESSTPPVAVGRAVIGEQIVRLSVALLDDSPYQSREAAAADWLDELTETLQREGQLSPCLVRPMPNGRYQLIAGHTRKQVAPRLKWTELDCRLVTCDDATAERLVLVENAKRRDLTELEKAKAYASLRDRYKTEGRTQAELAEALGISESALSNTIRLLILTGDLRTRFERGDLSIEQARAVATWARYPKFVEAFLAHAKDIGLDTGPIDTRHFESCVEYAIDRASRPMSKAQYGTSCDFTPTDEQREQLDICEVRRRHSAAAKRAFNVPIWMKLNNEAKQKKKQREAKKAAQQTAGKGQGKAPVERTERAAWRFKHEVADSWNEVRAQAITDKVVSGKLTKRQREIIARLWPIFTQKDPSLETLLSADWAAAIVEQVTQESADLAHRNRCLTFQQTEPPELLRIAQEFDADCDARWKPTQSLLEECAEADLHDLALECAIAAPAKSPPLLIAQLLSSWTAGYVPKLFELAIPKGKAKR